MITMPAAYRKDCPTRLIAILENMGDIKGKSLIDIGCANGYFMAGFLEAGGGSALGIEPDYNERADAASHDLMVTEHLDTKDNFDFGLYLDLHFHSQDYLPWLKEHCKTIFVSPSGDGEKNNMRLAEELFKSFKMVQLIHKTDYANRMIFKCQSA